MSLVICFRSSWSSLLLLVNGGLSGIPLQLLGHYFQILICWNYKGKSCHMVQSRLPHGSHLFARYCLPLQNWVFRGKQMQNLVIIVCTVVHWSIQRMQPFFLCSWDTVKFILTFLITLDFRNCFPTFSFAFQTLYLINSEFEKEFCDVQLQ